MMRAKGLSTAGIGIALGHGFARGRSQRADDAADP
ncbi:hypothetical protein ABIF42_007435 [Bradyrhizobium diazoefficiens]